MQIECVRIHSLFSQRTSPRAAAGNVVRGLINVLPAKLCVTLAYLEVMTSESFYVRITVFA